MSVPCTFLLLVNYQTGFLYKFYWFSVHLYYLLVFCTLHRLQLQTLLTGAILTEKITLWRARCLAKVVYTMETVVLNILTPVRITSFLPDSNSRLHGWGKWRAKCLAKVVHTMETVVLDIQTPFRITTLSPTSNLWARSILLEEDFRSILGVSKKHKQAL